MERAGVLLLLYGLGLLALAAWCWLAARGGARRAAAWTASAGAILAAMACLAFAGMLLDLCDLRCERVLQPPLIVLAGLLGSLAGGVALALPKADRSRAATWAAGAAALLFGLGFFAYYLDEMSRMGL